MKYPNHSARAHKENRARSLIIACLLIQLIYIKNCTCLRVISMSGNVPVSNAYFSIECNLPVGCKHPGDASVWWPTNHLLPSLHPPTSSFYLLPPWLLDSGIKCLCRDRRSTGV